MLKEKYEATRLEDAFTWEGADSLEFVDIWGVDVCRSLCHALDEELNGDPAHVIAIHILNELGINLEEISKLLHRFMDEIDEIKEAPTEPPDKESVEAKPEA